MSTSAPAPAPAKPKRKLITSIHNSSLSSPRPKHSSPLARNPPMQSRSSTPSSTLSDSSHLSTSSESSNGSDSDSDIGDEVSSPQLALKDRVSMFLPQLAASNADLDSKRALGQELNAGFEISAESAVDVESEVQTGAIESQERGSIVRERVRGAKRRKLVREVEPDEKHNEATNGGEEEQAASGQQEHKLEVESDENDGEAEQEPYIEMNLDLGVLEEQRNEASSSDESLSEEDEFEKPVLDKLMHVGKVAKKRKIRDHPAILEV